MSGSGLQASRVSELGSQFLAFIRMPEAIKQSITAEHHRL